MANIIFVISNMNLGGIQKSLLELLRALSETPHKVSLYCCNPVGPFLTEVPETVEIIHPSDYAKITDLNAKECRKIGYRFFLLRYLLSAITKLFGKAIPSKYICWRIGKLENKYDYAISYSQPLHDKQFCGLVNEIVLSCINAKKKITFLHCDFSAYGGNTLLNRNLYGQFDAIAAVSNSVGKVIKKIIPQIATKVFTVRNSFSAIDIINKSKDNPIRYNKTAIVTIARISSEKGLIRCIPIIKKLHGESYDFEWHIVGDGPLFRELKGLVVENELEKVVYLEGAQNNPYRFLKNASYLFLPSFHEAAPIVYDEAIALNVPVLTTRTLSADEIIGTEHGIVCENNEAGIEAMLKIALDKKITPQNNNSLQIGLDQFEELLRRV